MPPPLSTAWVWHCDSGVQKTKYSLEKASVFVNIYTVQKDVTYTKHCINECIIPGEKGKEMMLTSAHTSAHVLLPPKTKSIFAHFCRTSFSELFFHDAFKHFLYRTFYGFPAEELKNGFHSSAATLIPV